MSEKGQVLIAALILLAIIAIGIVWIMSVMGHNPLETTKNCYEVVYNSGYVGKICR